jgi:hypothetical protein
MHKDKDHIVEILLHSALGFHDIGINTAIHLEKTSDGYLVMQKIAPAAVNLSFSAELLLKGLILISKKRAKGGHSLVALFNHLSDEVKQTLEQHYNDHQIADKDKKELGAIKMVLFRSTEGPVVEDDYNLKLAKFLESHDIAFVKWRYNFEIETESLIYEIDFKSLNCLIKATVDTINSIPYKQRLILTSPK